jgi:hypothetical protein
MDHQVFDGEDVADSTSFPRRQFLPLPSRRLIEHYIPRHYHLASFWIVELVGLASFLVAQEHHGCAPVLQLAEERSGVLHMADAPKRP